MASASASSTAVSDAMLLEPFEYLCAHPGKNIRSQLIEAFNHWLRVPAEKLAVIKDAVEMLHTSSLLVDDIQDDSKLRRGIPVAHKIYGIALTINCANFVYFLALEKLLELKNPAVVEIYASELCNLHRGQGMDLYWRETNTCPTEAEYLQMIDYKTGGLLRLAVKLMQLESAVRDLDFLPLVNALGIHFQVRDDYINLSSGEYMTNKGFCEDITEGKFSLPVIHAVQSNPNSHQLLNILKQKTDNVEVVTYAVKVIREAGSLQYTVDLLRQFEARARHEVDRLGPNPAVSRILDALAEVYRDVPDTRPVM